MNEHLLLSLCRQFPKFPAHEKKIMFENALKQQCYYWNNPGIYKGHRSLNGFFFILKK